MEQPAAVDFKLEERAAQDLDYVLIENWLFTPPAAKARPAQDHVT